MDKAILKKFAIESRKDLMEKIKNKINTFYIDEEFKNEQKGDLYILSNEKHSLSLTNDEYKKRELLIKRIKELSLDQVIEEAAYTWFNRIIAIRYMEINDMLPLTRDNQSLGIRVLSSKDNTPDPEILKFTNLVNPELDIDFKKEKYSELKDDNEKFKYVLLLVCKKLGRVIPQVFDGITDYIDVLIPDNLLNDTGFITKVINEVPEDNYNQVEIIGWLYQYYNQTEKDRVINAKKVYKKTEIPYATQLFTPDWIVKYMVENSLGKYWVEHNGDGALYPSDNLYPSNNLYPSSSIIDNWKYFIKENIEKRNNKLNPTEITFIDPCCGSGHILVYAFEIFYQIYIKAGYNKNDIPELILSNNLYGLDIDDRAGQLSILSIILKAREYDKNIFNKKIIRDMNILSISESNRVSISILENMNFSGEDDNLKYLIELFQNAKEIGSLLNIEKRDYSKLENIILNDNTIFGIELREKIVPLIKVANILSNKYSIVVTNPPYMNNKYMSNLMKKYAQKNYEYYKNDLFSMFIFKCFNLNKDDGYIGMISPFVWMFIQSYEKLRDYIVNNKQIESLIQLEYNAFEVACVPVCTYVFRNINNENNKGIYIRLSDFPGADIQEEKTLEAINNKQCSFKYNVCTNVFKSIPDEIIAYWIPESMYEIFKSNKKIGEYGEPKKGLSTGDNNKYLRLWFEVENNKIGYNLSKYEDKYKWIPLNKGGDYRRWYGNNDYVINWNENGKELKAFDGSVIRNESYYFRKSITWTMLSSKLFGVRASNIGKIFEGAGPSLFVDDDDYEYILGLMLSKVGTYFINIFNPTMNINISDISNIPVIYDNKNKNEVVKLVKENIKIEKKEWDSYETSNDFLNNIFEFKEKTLEDTFNKIKKNNEYDYEILKSNEEKLNKIFIDLYNLNEQIDYKMKDEEITYTKISKEQYVKSFISYSVGCMFGRYSLDENGLVYAGGVFDKNKYKSFSADEDNIISITDEAYFGDDIVERFKNFIKVVYGNNTFNENMDFIAGALGKKGTETSEDTIRRYFVNDFFNEHVKTYQKRPIYWLFDSGKKNGFKALIYMHRFNENLIPKVRLDYLHRIQTTYERLLSDINYKLTTDLSLQDKKVAQNRQADLNAKLQEIKEYDEKIAHIANQRISIDLDDGVKVNYDKFKDILAKIK